MKGRGWALYGVLLAVAAALALAAGGSARRDSPVPSVTNPGPLGAAVAFTYLREAGFDVRVHRAQWSELPGDMATLVLASPEGREVSAADAGLLQEFLERGGRVVYLVPPKRNAQPALQALLGYDFPANFAQPPINPGNVADPSGTDAQVLIDLGPLSTAEPLRISGTNGLVMDSPLPVQGEGARPPGARVAIPIARTSSGPVGWYLRIGAGEAWLFAGPDLLENRRLDLGGNLAFWHRLAARGPLVFDEHHHVPEDGPAAPVALWGLGLQLLACFGIFVAARAQRLGPPRPEQAPVHRSMQEYLSSFAWLTRRARVEPELAKDLRARFRVLLHDRQGILVSLSDDEAARELEARCALPADATRAVLAELDALAGRQRVAARTFARAARELARLERVVTGRTHVSR